MLVVSKAAEMVEWFLRQVLPARLFALYMSVQDTAALVFDTFIYYIINGVMVVLTMMEMIHEAFDKAMYNYQIFLLFFKHEMYKNIN